MSFILDALKKSESDRQRQSGPALFEVKVAPPKSGFPVWAIAIVALLVVNMIIVGWMFMRRPSHGEDTAATNTAPASTNATAGTAPPPGSGAPQSAPSARNMPGPPSAPPFNGATGSNMSATNGPPGSMSAGDAAPAGGPAPGNGASPAGGMSAGNVISPSGSMSPPGAQSQSGSAGSHGQSGPPQNQQGMGVSQERMSDRDQNEPTLAGRAREADGANTEASGNPDDYAPAADAGSSLFKGHVKRATESGLQLYQDAAVASGGNLPELHLDLHVYAAQPQERFALVNMHRVHEGDTLQGGVRVESITPDGVVMSHNGSRFLLPRE